MAYPETALSECVSGTGHPHLLQPLAGSQLLASQPLCRPHQLDSQAKHLRRAKLKLQQLEKAVTDIAMQLNFVYMENKRIV